jgi:predicted Fe-Mo cluster-binding NifX family protein
MIGFKHSTHAYAASGMLFALNRHMRVAIPLWQGRVSPVFDEANRILLVDVSEKQEQRRQEESLTTRNPFERAQMLPKLGVDLLICGMISQTQQTALASAGIRIIPHICGPMEEVIAAFLEDRIENGALLMPGCGGCKRMRHPRTRLSPRKARAQ